jgi:uncharacterized protein (DUF58 family)
MNFKEIEKIVASIQHHIFKNSNSSSIGILKSHFRGSGLQFKEHQVYSHGDDVRFIDWKLTAKSKLPYVKTFEEERNVEINCVLDFNESMLLGYRGITKFQAAVEISCLLLLLADKTKDKVRISIVTEKIETLPASHGQAGIVQLISALQRTNIIDDEGRINIDRELKEKIEPKVKVAFLRSLIARKKQVIWLCDVAELNSSELTTSILKHPYMHTFRIFSPLEKNTDEQYSIWVNSKMLGNRLIPVKSKKEKKHSKELWKEINVKERYLESFIKEMN